MEFPKIHFQKAHFLISAPDIRHLDKHLPPESGIEVAFAGRSNAGKSSALNRLTRQKGLARTSKTPGRTQLINVFEVEVGKRLIDLPGYGFAICQRVVFLTDFPSQEISQRLMLSAFSAPLR